MYGRIVLCVMFCLGMLAVCANDASAGLFGGRGRGMSCNAPAQAAAEKRAPAATSENLISFSAPRAIEGLPVTVADPTTQYAGKSKSRTGVCKASIAALSDPAIVGTPRTQVAAYDASPSNN